MLWNVALKTLYHKNIYIMKSFNQILLDKDAYNGLLKNLRVF